MTTHTIKYIHLYTSELFLPGEQQEVGADDFQRVEGFLQTLQGAPSVAAERIFHHLIEMHHPETLSWVWLVGPQQSCSRGEEGLAVLVSPFVPLWCDSDPYVFLLQTPLQYSHIPPKQVLF